ncbi:MAG: DUF1343 domain-containing protein, partial [Fimbriimonadaceae bacterium]|nr:DUF1343 domain-containing protein [Fimbriimonadaceae bacterium]
DNMIEWEGYTDPRTGLRFYSLYGEHRKPTPAMLEGVDVLVYDVQEVGARYYTFIWTLALCLEACREAGVPVLVLDRPNPIDGVTVEGPGADPAYASFVGLYPLPVRHGMTVGEVGRLLVERYIPGAEIDVVETDGWDRRDLFPATGLPWALPSPNMPTPDTALVYPGQCLLEGTKLSEGRGTTRPFEIFGAPYIDGWRLAEELNATGLGGVVFRPVQFQPTFQKHKGEVCQGCFIHVSDPGTFQPVRATVALLHTVRRLWPDAFAWQDPPYEYEHTLMPVDILWGGPWLREGVDAGTPLATLFERMDDSLADWAGPKAPC